MSVKPTKPQAEVLALIKAGEIEYHGSFGAGARYRTADWSRDWPGHTGVVNNVICKGWSTGPTTRDRLYAKTVRLRLTPAGQAALDSTRKDKP